MSRKASPRTSSSVSPASTKADPRAKRKSAPKAGGTRAGAAPKTAPPKRAPARSSDPSNGPQAAKPSSEGNEGASGLLNRAEQGITTAIEILNEQMNTALTALAELASAQTDRGRVVVRTAPLDRATATFQRLVAEVVDDQLAEMLPPLIALRQEMAQWAAGGQDGSPEVDFHRRAVETIDHVLTLAGATSFDARPGQSFDPLIHLAIAETRREDLAEGAVAECVQPGFRSSRGKVLTPARVRINRR